MFSPPNLVNVLLRGVGLCSDVKWHFLVVVNTLLLLLLDCWLYSPFLLDNASRLGILLQKIPKFTIYACELATV